MATTSDSDQPTDEPPKMQPYKAATSLARVLAICLDGIQQGNLDPKKGCEVVERAIDQARGFIPEEYFQVEIERTKNSIKLKPKKMCTALILGGMPYSKAIGVTSNEFHDVEAGVKYTFTEEEGLKMTVTQKEDDGPRIALP